MLITIGLNLNAIKYNDKRINTTSTAPTYKQCSLKDIPYSYPVTFKGAGKDMEKRIKDSTWAKEQFEKLPDIVAKIDKDGLLILNKYNLSYDDFKKTFQDKGIDGNRLFENVKEIEGTADFSFYENLNLQSLTKAADVNCDYANNITFSQLKTAKTIYCYGAKNISFPELFEAENIYCKEDGNNDIDNVTFDKLTNAKHIDCYGQTFPSLVEADEIDCVEVNHYYHYHCKKNWDKKGGSLGFQDTKPYEENRNIFPKLRKVNKYINCAGSRNIGFPELIIAKDINCDEAKNISFDKLTNAANVTCQGASDIYFPKLKYADYVDCSYGKDIYFFSLLKVFKRINCDSAQGVIKFPSLEDATFSSRLNVYVKIPPDKNFNVDTHIIYIPDDPPPFIYNLLFDN